MRVMSFTALHYGKEYLEQAIRSVVDSVDKVVIAYNPSPSCGQPASMPCPEKRGELMDIAMEAAGDKLFWMDSGVSFWEANKMAEGWAAEHGYDVIVVADSDEVWIQEDLQHLVSLATRLDPTQSRYWTVTMAHLWQGFDMICRDHFRPVRVINMRTGAGECYLGVQGIYHFGYAISDELMRYKWDIHGHKPELRQGWMEEKWLARATEDVHPVVHGLWNAKPFDKNNLPSLMRSHPRWNGS